MTHEELLTQALAIADGRTLALGTTAHVKALVAELRRIAKPCNLCGRFTPEDDLLNAAQNGEVCQSCFRDIEAGEKLDAEEEAAFHRTRYEEAG